MASGKQGLFVVVWEWENKQRRWRPYPPEVTQQLERAYSKNLRLVYLRDSDPSLKNYTINLPQMEQECQVSGERVKVRRTFYPQSSPAGQGAVWQWAGDVEGDWHTYDMCVQCVIEESWGTGAQTLDMSVAFPLCPYVINFCNLTQMNSKTGFIRAIRRVQQAAYPVGKPPTIPPHHHINHHNPAPSSSACAGSASGSSCAKGKRRGSRDEVDATSAEGTNKARAIFDKVLGRGHNSSRNSSMSPPASTGGSSVGRGRGQMFVGQGGGACSAPPPKPLPRSNVPPVPRPRTCVPPQTYPYPTTQLQSDPHHHYFEDHDSQKHSTNLGHEGAGGRFGSNHTLDSDCSSLVSGRRPSVDTISTYLSQESGTGEDEAHGSGTSSTRTSSHHNQAGSNGNPRVDQLIHVESDESMDDDDVFGEDQEVCDVMRGVAQHSSPPRAPSPPPHHHHSHHNSNNSHAPQHSQNHFVPISAPQPRSDLGLQFNGVKRKRTGERAGAGHSGNPSMHSHNHHPNHHHNHSHYNNNNNGSYHHHKHQQGSRAPIALEDQLLIQYTNPVTSPPDEMCSICMWSLNEPSGYAEEDNTAIAPSSQIPGVGVVSLVLCGHQFHLACLRQMAKSTPQFLACPNCKTLHGEKLGNQPRGQMIVTTLYRSLPGHPDCSTVEITYNITGGTQGPEHPHPGRPYFAVGFPRTAYVPNNDKGQKVVRLLREAWRRRLIFTIGRSVTLGMEDCVTWNEIHHKTEWDNYSGHGYPDPHYLDNVLKELELHGVTESTLV